MRKEKLILKDGGGEEERKKKATDIGESQRTQVAMFQKLYVDYGVYGLKIL